MTQRETRKDAGRIKQVKGMTPRASISECKKRFSTKDKMTKILQ